MKRMRWRPSPPSNLFSKPKKAQVKSSVKTCAFRQKAITMKPEDKFKFTLFYANDCLDDDWCFERSGQAIWCRQIRVCSLTPKMVSKQSGFLSWESRWLQTLQEPSSTVTETVSATKPTHFDITTRCDIWWWLEKMTTRISRRGWLIREKEVQCTYDIKDISQFYTKNVCDRQTSSGRKSQGLFWFLVFLMFFCWRQTFVERMPSLNNEASSMSFLDSIHLISVTFCWLQQKEQKERFSFVWLVRSKSQRHWPLNYTLYAAVLGLTSNSRCSSIF